MLWQRGTLEGYYVPKCRGRFLFWYKYISGFSLYEQQIKVQTHIYYTLLSFYMFKEVVIRKKRCQMFCILKACYVESVCPPPLSAKNSRKSARLHRCLWFISAALDPFDWGWGPSYAHTHTCRAERPQQIGWRRCVFVFFLCVFKDENNAAPLSLSSPLGGEANLANSDWQIWHSTQYKSNIWLCLRRW